MSLEEVQINTKLIINLMKALEPREGETVFVTWLHVMSNIEGSGLAQAQLDCLHQAEGHTFLHIPRTPAVPGHSDKT